jgi:hypothetical protein
VEGRLPERREADAARRASRRRGGRCRVLVTASVEAALRRLDESDPERAWARVSRADLMFMFEPSDRRVLMCYHDAVPRDNPSLWDAVYTQLRLFEDLGVRAERARAVIAHVEARLKPAAAAARPAHVVVFAGHRVDAAGRRVPRFRRRRPRGRRS